MVHRCRWLAVGIGKNLATINLEKIWKDSLRSHDTWIVLVPVPHTTTNLFDEFRGVCSQSGVHACGNLKDDNIVIDDARFRAFRQKMCTGL